MNDNRVLYAYFFHHSLTHALFEEMQWKNEPDQIFMREHAGKSKSRQ